MINKGLIVNIQDYSNYVTQELAVICEQSGAIGVRTDQHINLVSTKIGFCTIPERKYSITTTKEAINQVNKWADYVSIDCRRGNNDLMLLFAYCHQQGIQVVAEIGDIKDFENIIQICEGGKMNMPSAISTLFSNDINLIKQIKEMRDIQVIANCDIINIEDALKIGADCVLVGNLIANVGFLCKSYLKYIKEVNNE